MKDWQTWRHVKVDLQNAEILTYPTGLDLFSWRMLFQHQNDPTVIHQFLPGSNLNQLNCLGQRPQTCHIFTFSCSPWLPRVLCTRSKPSDATSETLTKISNYKYIGECSKQCSNETTKRNHLPWFTTWSQCHGWPPTTWDRQLWPYHEGSLSGFPNHFRIFGKTRRLLWIWSQKPTSKKNPNSRRFQRNVLRSRTQQRLIGSRSA